MIPAEALGSGVWSLSPRGRVNTAATPDLEHALTQLLDQGRSRIVVDCRDVVYVASAGLRALLLGHRRAAAAGGAVHLADVSPAVLQAFHLAGLDQLFRIFPDVPAAAAALRGTDGS